MVKKTCALAHIFTLDSSSTEFESSYVYFIGKLVLEEKWENYINACLNEIEFLSHHLCIRFKHLSLKCVLDKCDICCKLKNSSKRVNK